LNQPGIQPICYVWNHIIYRTIQTFTS